VPQHCYLLCSIEVDSGISYGDDAFTVQQPGYLIEYFTMYLTVLLLYYYVV
jgi:hypothetical protein